MLRERKIFPKKIRRTEKAVRRTYSETSKNSLKAKRSFAPKLFFGSFFSREKGTQGVQRGKAPLGQSLATPVRRAASATAFATAGPTLGSNALGII